MPVEEKNGWVHITPDVLPPMRVPSDEDDDFEDVVSVAPENTRKPVEEEQSS